MKEIMKKDPNKLIDVIKERVRHVDYTEDTLRKDIIDYIAAKVKGQIAPYLRLARSVRRGYYPKWVEFQKLLEHFKLQDTLTRENNYSPIPERVLNHWESGAVLDLEDHIFFFNLLHDKEDRKYNRLFEESFEGWARPALVTAFDRVDIEKSDREIVAYVSRVFYTEYVANRAKSQGMQRKRRNDKWEYYYVQDINDEDFGHNDVMQVIFQSDREDYPSLSVIADKLTKNQTQLLIKLYNYVRDDVSLLSTERFYKKYPHKRMNYKLVSEKLEISYDSLVKNIQRMKVRID